MHRLGIDPIHAGWPVECANEFALVQEVNAVGYMAGAVDIVGHQQDGPAGLGKIPDQPVEFVDRYGVETRRRLVQGAG